MNRLVGIVVGALVLLLFAFTGGGIALDAGLSLGPAGQLVAEMHDARGRLFVLMLAAAAGGAASSVAARDYFSGTSVLSAACGMLGVCAASAALGPQPSSSADTFEPAIAALETVPGILVLLTAYTCAWQIDLRWVLPRRRPGYTPKRVGFREVCLRGVPALGLCATLIALLAATCRPALRAGLPETLGWIVACAASSAATQGLFNLRSTFFLWTAPALAVLSAVLLAPESSGVWGRLPAACVVPAGALGAALGYLALRVQRPAQRPG